MYDFWDSILFGNVNFKGNPMQAHIDLNKKSKMENAHFDIWLELWHKNADELFEGEKTEEVKLRAKNIAALMMLKVKA